MKMMKRMGNSIEGLLGKNLGTKILALVFALFMWIYVMSVINPVVNDNVNNVPVQLLNLEELESDGLVIKDDADFVVNLRVSGRSDVVYRLSRSDFVVTADLTGHRNIGMNTIQVDVQVDADVDIEYTPRHIRVELEEVVRRQKPVELEIIGELASGYMLGDRQITPSVIWVEGPESNVNSVQSVLAELELNDEDSDIRANLSLKAIDAEGNEVQGVRLESEAVEVFLPVEQTKEVTIKINAEIETGEGFILRNITVNPETVIVRGREDRLEDLTEIETEFVQREGITEGETIQVNLNLPEGIQMVQNEIIYLEVEIVEETQETINIPAEQLSIEGLEEDLEINPEEFPETFTVRFFTPADLIENIRSNSIELFINLEGLGIGIHTVDLQYRVSQQFSDEIRDIEVEPSTVVIEILPPEEPTEPDEEENDENGENDENDENEDDSEGGE